MKDFSYLIACLFLFSSCSTWKEVLVAEGNQNDAIQNAIYDFLHSGKLSKKDSVFSVYTTNINDEILGVSISGDINTLLVVTEDSVEYSYRGFPTKYFEQQGKLFYWDDSTINVTDDLVNALTRYNRVDTMIVNTYIPERIIDHSKEGMHYYFCKDNLLKYKKVKTNVAMGYYNPPNLNCK